MKRVVVVGGGPAGLYAALLLKKAAPGLQVDLYERNRPDDTFGWGVVFSDQTMTNFREADRQSHTAILDGFYHWDAIDVYFGGERIRSNGHGFCGIGRRRLLNILQERAAELGVRQHFRQEIEGPEEEFSDADLIVAADGVNSKLRAKHAQQLRPTIATGRCRFIWLGTRQTFAAFTFAFERTEHGWFQIHAYQFSQELSTVIVETREETWRAHGLNSFNTEQSIEFCERLFAKYLGGETLLSNANHLRGSAWLNFNRVLCEKWHVENLVLIGDAAHTAHFSIGSGTKLAMEDAISLVRRLSTSAGVPEALHAYHEDRSLEALRLQSAARNRMEWFENVARYTRLKPRQFAYALLTSSQRIGHQNLKMRDPDFVAAYETWLAGECGVVVGTPPPMFLPLRLGEMNLANRVVVAPMAQYRAKDGVPNEWHLMHYGARAMGGAGLLFTEMTCVSATGRISLGCTGLWNETQRDAWRKIVEFVHLHSPAKFCLQLGHSGRKGSTQLGWEKSDWPLASDNWPLIAPSPLPYLPGVSQVPRTMNRLDMDEVSRQFAQAARFGLEANFDMLELHLAHGYLLASFLSPLTNKRDDAYGGAIEGRMRFVLEVFAGVREVWPRSRPLSARISATDWAAGGLSVEDLIAIAQALKATGADILDVSSGQTVPHQEPIYGRMWQTPYSDRIRNEVDIPTIAVGNIYEPDHVNSIIAAGRADLCALARPHLANPAWTLDAAAHQGYQGQWWPEPYLSGKAQLQRNSERAMSIAGPV